jgi:hypothetical protein
MREEDGTIEGDLRVTEDLELNGTLTKTATVAAGATLFVNGTVGGDLVLERGSSAVVVGTVSGSVINRGGSLRVSGRVAGKIRRISGTTQLEPGAIVNG